MNRPTVSIIIPCYNGERFVAQAIQSALSQTFTALDIVVIDDGSTDESRRVIQEFGAAIRWESGPNRGGSAARNRGLELARGEYIQFLDCDDVMHPDCVARKMETPRNSPEDVPCSAWVEMDLRGVSTVRRPHVGTDDPVVDVLEGPIPVSSPLHRRIDLIRIAGFRTTLPCCQERDLHLRLACAGARFVDVPHTLFTVRKRPGSVSDDYVRVLLQHRNVFLPAMEGLRLSGGLTRARNVAFARAMAADARRLYRRGRRREAREYWRLAGKIDRTGLLAAYGQNASRRIAGIFGPETAEVASTLASPYRVFQQRTRFS